MLGNLLVNAIRRTPADGTVAVAAERRAGRASSCPSRTAAAASPRRTCRASSTPAGAAPTPGHRPPGAGLGPRHRPGHRGGPPGAGHRAQRPRRLPLRGDAARPRLRGASAASESRGGAARGRFLSRAAPPVHRGPTRPAARRRANSRIPSANPTSAFQPSSARSRAESAVMCRTSPSRYSPVTTGSGPPYAAASARAISPTVCGSPLPVLYAVSAPSGRTRLQRRHVGRGHVPHVHEVPALAAVLEDARGLAAGERGAEEGGDARVRGVAGHARPVHVVVAQRHRRPARGPRPRRRQVLLGELGRRVHVARVDRGVLADQARRQLRAAHAGTAARSAPRPGRRRPAAPAAPPRAARRCSGPRRTPPSTRPARAAAPPPRPSRRAARPCRGRCGRRTPAASAKSAAQADHRRLMAHRVHAGQRARRRRRGPVRPTPGRPRTSNTTGSCPCAAQRLDDMGPDEPGTAGDQYTHAPHARAVSRPDGRAAPVTSRLRKTHGRVRLSGSDTVNTVEPGSAVSVDRAAVRPDQGAARPRGRGRCRPGRGCGPCRRGRSGRRPAPGRRPGCRGRRPRSAPRAAAVPDGHLHGHRRARRGVHGRVGEQVVQDLADALRVEPQPSGPRGRGVTVSGWSGWPARKASAAWLDQLHQVGVLAGRSGVSTSAASRRASSSRSSRRTPIRAASARSRARCLSRSSGALAAAYWKRSA